MQAAAAAASRREQGMARASRAITEEELKAAAGELRLFARTNTGRLFTIEQAREGYEMPSNVDGRVWGAVTKLAERRGYITRVRGAFMPAMSLPLIVTRSKTLPPGAAFAPILA